MERKWKAVEELGSSEVLKTIFFYLVPGCYTPNFVPPLRDSLNLPMLIAAFLDFLMQRSPEVLQPGQFPKPGRAPSNACIHWAILPDWFTLLYVSLLSSKVLLWIDFT